MGECNQVEYRTHPSCTWGLFSNCSAAGSGGDGTVADIGTSSWQARIDEQRRLKMARTQEHDSHARIGWEVQELTSSFFAFSIYMLLEQAWLNSHHARLPGIPRTIVGHSLHVRHVSECTFVCGTGQPPRLATPFNRVHLLQLDLDPDSTRSATSNPRSSRSNTIGNYNSPITPIGENTHTTRLEHTMAWLLIFP
jgi:hypothetical protein